ncbi:MAG: hypothetical protein HY360_21780, partial [Verrucomicrobia bacterium]|nr:hypothetical protein [Verrucomicrobiota bacterium]
MKAGANPITIRVEDDAGNQAQATLNWTVDPSTDIVIPGLFNLNLMADQGPGATGAITAPDISQVWVQGKMNDPNSIVTVSVNDGNPIEFSVAESPVPAAALTFGGFVALEAGDNKVLESGEFSVIFRDVSKAATPLPPVGGARARCRADQCCPSSNVRPIRAPP